MPDTRYPNTLDTKSIAFAHDNLNEAINKRHEYITKIRDHFAIHEPNVKLTTEDDILVAFLRGCKYNLPKAITKLKNYYVMKSAMPAVFTDRDPKKHRLQELLKIGCFVPLRQLQNGRMIIVIRTAAFDPKIYQFEEILKVSYIILDVCSKICPQMQVHGVCAIFDLHGMSLAHARMLTPSIIKHMVNSWENYHCRPQQLEFINAPMYVNVILNVFRRFMSQKLKDRVRVHYGGHLPLHEFIDKAALPKEYDGDDESFEEHVQVWVKLVTQFRDWLMFDEQFKIVKSD